MQHAPSMAFVPVANKAELRSHHQRDGEDDCFSGRHRQAPRVFFGRAFGAFGRSCSDATTTAMTTTNNHEGDLANNDDGADDGDDYEGDKPEYRCD